MKTELRRVERTMKTREEMEKLLERMPVGCLSVTTEDGPYAVAMNYLFHNGHIYLHGAKAGRKTESLKRDPRVCFLVYEDGPQVVRDESCGISQIYKSVICSGKASLVEDTDEKKLVLKKMIGKYAPEYVSAQIIDAENVERTAVIKIAIEAMSGKTNETTPTNATLI